MQITYKGGASTSFACGGGDASPLLVGFTITHFRKALLAMVFIALFLLPVTVFAANLGLIDAASLQRSLSAWVVLDARPRADWEAGHIPGALSFSWENYTRTDERGVRYRVFPPKELAIVLGRFGIDERTPIVVYGDADKSWGGEGWDIWVLSWLGHNGPIRLLDSGFQAWRGQRLSLVKGAEKKAVKPAEYNISVKPELDISTEELDRTRASVVIVDVRSTLERLRGKIPGSIHINWEDFYSGTDRKPLSPKKLKKLLADNAVNTSRPVVYYCTGGIRSAYAWLVHELSGLPHARNYGGGMEAWQKRANTTH
jgi:thiosulfate/3-mercaptopyruvate sulfurtransferase